MFERAGALSAAGQPVRHGGVRGRAARDVERDRRRRRARAAASARAAAPRAAPRGVPRRAVGGRVRRDRRLDRRAAVPDRPLQRATTRAIVWIILAGSALGLSAGTQGRLLGSAFYALGDPRPPLHAALVRVAITGAPAMRSRCRCATRSATRGVGRVRPDRERRVRRVDRVPAAAPLARRAHRQGRRSRRSSASARSSPRRSPVRRDTAPAGSRRAGSSRRSPRSRRSRSSAASTSAS